MYVSHIPRTPTCQYEFIALWFSKFGTCIFQNSLLKDSFHNSCNQIIYGHDVESIVIDTMQPWLHRRSSATMVLTMKDKMIFRFYTERFQLLVRSLSQEIIDGANIISRTPPPPPPKKKKKKKKALQHINNNKLLHIHTENIWTQHSPVTKQNGQYIMTGFLSKYSVVLAIIICLPAVPNNEWSGMHINIVSIYCLEEPGTANW